MNMLELIITSSILILVVLALRLVLRKRVSQRLIYALWLLVAVRLLVPVSFVQSPVSVMNPVSTVVAQAAARADAAVSQAATGQAGQTGGETDPLAAGGNGQTAQAGQNPTANTDPSAANNPTQPESPATDTPTAKLPWWLTALRFVQANNYRVLKLMWLAGTVGVGLWLLAVNIIFRRKLRKNAIPIKVVRCALPLYWCEDIPSPCLVGLFKPAIYITRFSADEQDKLTDVITHELCHWKQWDHVWAMVRCVCVAAYWFNPLVWVAARASRADCELSCDEAVIKKLGEARRIEYGRTLVRMIGARSDYSDRGLAATAMTSDKKGIKARIYRIASNPKRSILSVVALALCAVIVCACTFSGATDGDTSSKPDSAFANLDGVTRFVAYSAVTDSWELFEALDEPESSTAPLFTYDYTHNAYYDVTNDFAAMNGTTVAEAAEELSNGGYTILLCVDPAVQATLEDVAYNPIYWDTETYGRWGEQNDIIWPALDYTGETKNDNQIQAAMVVMNYNGEVLGLTNGLREKGSLSRSGVLYTRQPGSAIKPLADYAPALEVDKIDYSTVFPDSPSETINGLPWPRNYSNSYGEAVTVYDALRVSLNTTAIYAQKLIGVDASFHFLRNNVGITTLADDVVDNGVTLTDRTMAMGLGGLVYGVHPVELCAAYQIFGNDGTYTTPHTYTKVYDRDGVLVLDNAAPSSRIQAISPDTAMIMNRLLQGVAKAGTGTAMMQDSTLPVAAKTGTTSDNSDFWAVGMNPYYVMAVWEGYDVPEYMQTLRPHPTQQAFNLVMNEISKDLEYKTFPVADNVISASYCTATGRLASDTCPFTATGYYKKGNVPNYCTHENVPASVFTD